MGNSQVRSAAMCCALLRVGAEYVNYWHTQLVSRGEEMGVCELLDDKGIYLRLKFS
jgi:hypothetical protein